MTRVSTEQVLNKAYRLAYFLHQDKATAIRIVTAATLKLNVAMAVQSKRLYYNPVGRFSRGESRRTDGIRNKTLFSDLHLLQRLIFVESEPYERQKERAAQVAPPGVHAVGEPATEEDLLVYFIKHLVRITTKRNAFYVTLGVSRLLHSYSTLETMEIYNAVIGEPERVKDDYYYRSRKAVLMHEMYQRFGQLIRACRQRRGEERFETQPGSSEQRSLTRECLRLFTPWETQCPVPHDFDPLKSVIASLTSRSSADENRLEVSRIHAVLHPDCFERLVAAFGYSAPRERMELPRFFLDQTNDDQDPPRQRSAPDELNSEELTEINDMLAEQARRRRRSSSTGILRVMVDGVERGTLNPAEQSSTSFTIAEDAELIEVKTTDSSGDLLLATHLITSFGKDARDKVIVASIRSESGQRLLLTIRRRANDVHGGDEFLVEFGYRETSLRRAVRLWRQRKQDPNARRMWGGTTSARHVLVAASVLLVCLIGYLAYVTLRSPQTVGPPQTGSMQTTPSPIADSRAEVIDPPGTEAPSRTIKPNRTAPKPPQRVGAATPHTDAPAETPDEDAGEAMRSGSAVTDLTLGEVKKIYIEIRGKSAFDDLGCNLGEGLNSSGIVAAATNADDADAALKILVGDSQASVQLVNARGTVLWSRRYSGELSKVMTEIVKDLLSEIRRARAGH